jgi:hypothetical protein
MLNAITSERMLRIPTTVPTAAAKVAIFLGELVGVSLDINVT